MPGREALARVGAGRCASWQRVCSFEEQQMEDLGMLQSLRQSSIAPWVSSPTLLSTGVVTGFFALLLEGQIHPVVVYFLQLYLSL